MRQDRRRRYSDDQYDQMRQMIEAGHTYVEIRQKFGISRQSLVKHFRGLWRNLDHSSFTVSEREHWRKLAAEGMTHMQIAKMAGVACTTIRYYLGKKGYHIYSPKDVDRWKAKVEQGQSYCQIARDEGVNIITLNRRLGKSKHRRGRKASKTTTT